MADNIARATVSLGVDKEAFLKEVGETADAGATKMGSIFTKIADAGGTYGKAAEAIVAIGAGFLAIGSKFEESLNVIRQSTGVTGKVLSGLGDSFKDVFSSTPGANFENVAAAISEVYDRTKLTGAPLDDLTKKFVELGKVAHVDVGQEVQSATALFNNFGIAAKNQSAELDVLYKASQLAGVGIDTLTQNVQAAAPVAQTLGLNLNQTTALVAQLTAAGLPATKVMMGLGMEFAKAAKAGKDPTSVIGQLVSQIKAAPNATDAATIAIKNFGIGARQAATLVDAVRAGTLTFGATLAQITSGKGGIDDTAQATMTLGDRFKIFKNEALTALEPVASKALEFANIFATDLPIAFRAVGSWFSDLGAAWDRGGLGSVLATVGTQVFHIGEAVVNGISSAAVAIAAKIADWATAFWSWATAVWPKLGPALASIYTDVTGWVGKNLPKVGAWASAFWDWVTGVWPVLTAKLADLYTSISGWVTTTIPKVGVWADAFANWVGDVWKDLIVNLDSLYATVNHWVVTNLPVLGKWRDAFVDWVGQVWPGISQKLSDAYDAMSAWVAATAPKLAADMSTWAVELYRWIDSALPGALQHFSDFMTGLGGWFDSQAGPWMNKNFGKWGEALGKWLADNAPMLVLKFDVLLAAIGVYILTRFLPELVKSIGLAMVTFSVQIGKGVAEGALGAVQGLSKGIGDAVTGAIKEALNGAIGLINTFLSWMHSNLKIDIGGGSFLGQSLPELKIGFPDIQIPKLAAGTPDFAGGPAWVGEQGPELAFLPRHTQVVSHHEVLRAAANLGRQGAAAGGGFHVGDIYVTAPTAERTPIALVEELRTYAFLSGAA